MFQFFIGRMSHLLYLSNAGELRYYFAQSGREGTLLAIPYRSHTFFTSYNNNYNIQYSLSLPQRSRAPILLISPSFAIAISTAQSIDRITMDSSQTQKNCAKLSQSQTSNGRMGKHHLSNSSILLSNSSILPSTSSILDSLAALADYDLTGDDLFSQFADSASSLQSVDLRMGITDSMNVSRCKRMAKNLNLDDVDEGDGIDDNDDKDARTPPGWASQRRSGIRRGQQQQAANQTQNGN